MNKKIPFSGGQSSGLDALAGGMPAQVNVTTDAAGAAWMRPGIVAWDDYPATAPTTDEVTGIGVWNGYTIFTTTPNANGHPLWAITSPGVATALSDATAATRVNGVLKPIFTPTRTRMVISAGGPPQKWEGAGLSARLGGSPPSMTHTVAISQRLVGNGTSAGGLIYWSGIGEVNHETWVTGSEFREAETEPDDLIALYKSANELVAIGTRTVQMLSPDPSITFSNARTLQYGGAAPRGVVLADEQFLILDTRKRIMLSNGRGSAAVSSPAIARDLDRMSTVDDCWGFRYHIEGHDMAVFTFPTEGKTFAYDIPAKAWQEWRSWRNGAWADLAISAHCYDEDNKVHLVGLSDGRIARFDADTRTEMGEPLIAEVTSPFVNQGTAAPKLTNWVRFTFRRGGASSSTAVALVSFRNDLGAFGEPYRLTLGDSSDVNPTVVIRSVGIYEQRQWRISVDSGEFVLAEVEEDFTVLQG